MSANKGILSRTLGGIALMLFSILCFIRAETAAVHHKPIFFRYPLLVRGGTSMNPWQGFALAGLCFGLGTVFVIDASRRRRQRNANLSSG